ncbi:unnamed protein product [Closterium sp. NIES-65]|nr:unnamed protein product [Closterium sp. NIES-65]
MASVVAAARLALVLAVMPLAAMASPPSIMSTVISFCPDEHFSCASPSIVRAPSSPADCVPFFPDHADVAASYVIVWDAQRGISTPHSVCRALTFWDSPDCARSSASFSVNMPGELLSPPGTTPPDTIAAARRAEAHSHSATSGYFGPTPTYASIGSVSCAQVDEIEPLIHGESAQQPLPVTTVYEPAADGGACPCSAMPTVSIVALSVAAFCVIVAVAAIVFALTVLELYEEAKLFVSPYEALLLSVCVRLCWLDGASWNAPESRAFPSARQRARVTSFSVRPSLANPHVALPSAHRSPFRLSLYLPPVALPSARRSPFHRRPSFPSSSTLPPVTLPSSHRHPFFPSPSLLPIAIPSSHRHPFFPSPSLLPIAILPSHRHPFFSSPSLPLVAIPAACPLAFPVNLSPCPPSQRRGFPLSLSPCFPRLLAFLVSSLSPSPRFPRSIKCSSPSPSFPSPFPSRTFVTLPSLPPLTPFLPPNNPHQSPTYTPPLPCLPLSLFPPFSALLPTILCPALSPASAPVPPIPFPTRSPHTPSASPPSPLRFSSFPPPLLLLPPSTSPPSPLRFSSFPPPPSPLCFSSFPPPLLLIPSLFSPLLPPVVDEAGRLLPVVVEADRLLRQFYHDWLHADVAVSVPVLCGVMHAHGGGSVSGVLPTPFIHGLQSLHLTDAAMSHCLALVSPHRAFTVFVSLLHAAHSLFLLLSAFPPASLPFASAEFSSHQPQL